MGNNGEYKLGLFSGSGWDCSSLNFQADELGFVKWMNWLISIKWMNLADIHQVYK
jgi:hypothetical protein